MSGTPKNTDWISDVIRDLCEIPDRNSPEDFPAGIVATEYEIRQKIEEHSPVADLERRLREGQEIRAADSKREYGCSQQTVDALTNERNALKKRAEAAEKRAADHTALLRECEDFIEAVNQHRDILGSGVKNYELLTKLRQARK